MIKALQELKADTDKIMAGRESSYFLISTGTVKSCGRNDEGQLGDGTFVNNEFTTVENLENYKITHLGSGPSSQSAFFFGEDFVLGVGANDRFQLGIGDIGSEVSTVVIMFDDLDTVAGITKISSSGSQTVALNTPVRQDKTDEPTFTPTAEPTGEDSDEPTFTPTVEPTGEDSDEPTFTPTVEPTAEDLETSIPTFSPTAEPTSEDIETETPTACKSLCLSLLLLPKLVVVS